LIYAHLKRPDIKPLDTDRIANALELVVGNGLSPAQASRKLNLPIASICGWLTKYWFYNKPNNPVIINLKSKL
jgi:hypothetical protein